MTYKHLYSIVALASFLVMLPTSSHARAVRPDTETMMQEGQNGQLPMNPSNQGIQREIQRVSTTPSQDKNTMQTLRAEKDATKAKLQDEKQAVCDTSTKRIDEKIASYQQNHTEQVTKYQKLVVQLQDVITKMTAQGKDVTKLQSDLTQLNTQITKLETDQKTFIDKLNATKAFPCGNSNGQYVAAVKAARDAQKTVITDAQNIRKFFEVTVRADIRALKTRLDNEAKLPRPSTSPRLKLSITPGIDYRKSPITRPVITPEPAQY